MKNLNIYCITIYDEHIQLIKDFDYLPVGLGNKIQSKYFIRDNTKIQMSKKNPYYGEYTFHYWIWKNYLNEIKTNWVGFCQYRKFFAEKELSEKNIKFEQFKQSIIHEIDISDKSYDCILGNKFSVQNYKLSKQ